MRTLVLAPDLDDRYGVGKVTSRIGIEADAITFKPDDNLLKIIESSREIRSAALCPDRRSSVSDQRAGVPAGRGQ